MNKLKLLISLLLFFSFGFQMLIAQDKVVFQKTIKMEGRIMYDFNFLSAVADKEELTYNFSGNEFRRMRLAAKGAVAENVSYKAEFDFSGGKLGFRDVFLQFSFPNNYGSLKVGSFTEPSSLDNMTSSKYITFFERSMMSNTQPFKYNAGFMYENYDILNKKIGLQLSYTFGGDKNKAFLDKYIKEGANLVGRLTGVVYQNNNKNQVVHLGVNFENRKSDNKEYSYTYRLENHMGQKINGKLDDHDVLEGLISKTNVENVRDMGIELGTTFGVLSFQSEYEISTINTVNEAYKSIGYYAFVSYFLTGEHRSYKNSSFGRIKPIKDFSINKREFGALEIALRYSAMNYTGYPEFSRLDSSYDFSSIDKDRVISNLTLGLNWYLNNYTRVMYNYTNGDTHDFRVYGDGNNLIGHLLRFQIDF